MHLIARVEQTCTLLFVMSFSWCYLDLLLYHAKLCVLLCGLTIRHF